MKPKKVLIVQPTLQPPGGGNAVCAWILEAIKNQYDLSVLSLRPVDLASINRHYGTALEESELTCCLAYAKIISILDRIIPTPTSLVKTSLLLRACKKIKDNYDLLITANNEADFGRRGIQYIHYPWGFPRPLVDLRWYHGPVGLVRLYHRFCERLADFSLLRMKGNVTLVNSDWIAGQVKARYPGMATRTVYPPVSGRFHEVPWERKENGFLCIGRISPEKEIVKVIAILDRVRSRVPDLHFHIVGNPDDPSYFQTISGHARARASWIHLDLNLPRTSLLDLISRHRFGIHGMEEEHFGMAIAEMITAGCLVFAPDSGGQKEIIGDCPELLYRNPDDAVAKIVKVLRSSERQKSLRSYLGLRAERFSCDRFMAEIRHIVAELAS